MPNSSTADIAELRVSDKQHDKDGHREFHHVFHHPIVHTAQHVASPLSGALVIFFIHKRWQVPSQIASLRAQAILARHGQLNYRQIARSAALGAGTLGLLYTAKQNAPPYLEVTDAHRKSMSQLYQLSTVPSIDEALTKWWTAAYINQGMEALHSWSGMPWWGTILASTLCLRFCLVPVNMFLLRNSTRMKFILPDINELHQTMQTGTAPAKLEAAKKLQTLFATHKCNPWKQCIFFPIVLPATVLAFFTSVHNLCMCEPTMAEEGTLWFPDLIARDDSYLLPILSGLTWLWMVEMGSGIHFRTYPSLRTAVRCIAASTIPLAATLPSGVFVFWITSNMFAITRAYVLRNNAVRRRFGIPLQKDVNALLHLPKYKGD